MLPLIPVLTSFGPKITLKEPSEKRAAKVLPQVVQSALSGNLIAVAVLFSRTTFGISAERAVWQGGYNQVAAQRPDVVAQYQARAASLIVPAAAQSSPEAAAQYAVANVVTASTATAGSSLPPGTSTSSPTLQPQGSPTAAASSKLWGVLALLAAAGALLYVAVSRRGR
jgi:hypothetical protein